MFCFQLVFVQKNKLLVPFWLTFFDLLDFVVNGKKQRKDFHSYPERPLGGHVTDVRDLIQAKNFGFVW